MVRACFASGFYCSWGGERGDDLLDYSTNSRQTAGLVGSFVVSSKSVSYLLFSRVSHVCLGSYVGPGVDLQFDQRLGLAACNRLVDGPGQFLSLGTVSAGGNMVVLVQENRAFELALGEWQVGFVDSWFALSCRLSVC